MLQVVRHTVLTSGSASPLEHFLLCRAQRSSRVSQRFPHTSGSGNEMAKG